MFEAGFLEMLIIGVIALLVVGPERLPGLARKAGALIGKVRRFVTTTRSDIEREIRTDEMRNMLIMQEEKIRDLQSAIQDTGSKAKQELDSALGSINEGINETVSSSKEENTIAGGKAADEKAIEAKETKQ
jgi:sec-independent protein translocase protein TatB